MNQKKQVASLNKRYFSKLLSNLFGLFIGLFTQAIVPRGLGPKVYGDFQFLSNFFTQLVGFFDMGTSTCFYVKLSQRPKEHGLSHFYLLYSAVIFLLMIIVVGITQFASIQQRVWPDQEQSYIYLGVLLGFLMWFSGIVNQMTDAYGITVYAEFAKIFQKIIGLGLLMFLFLLHELSLRNFFFYNYFVLVILVVFFSILIKRGGYLNINKWGLSRNQLKSYGGEFYQYSKPFFVYSVIGLFVGIFDKWLLQLFSGSAQQGYFGLSFQIGAVCFVFTGAMTTLLTREFSIAFASSDLIKMAQLHRRYVPMLYSITAYLSCFIAVQAEGVIYIFGGKEYQNALAATAIMAFYPLFQTCGQLNAAVFFATGQIGLYRNIGMIFMLVGLPVTYFFIAPTDRMGINAGATGLAVKMVIMAALAVNVQLYFIARFLKFSFRSYLTHQILTVGCLLLAAYGAAVGVELIGGVSRQNIITNFLISGIIYTIGVAGIGYAFPVLFGLGREDIRSTIRTFADKFKRGR